MPSTITHYYFAKDVYTELDFNIRQNLEDYKNYFHLFAQGSDPLYFYNILPFKKDKIFRNYGNITHNNCEILIVNLINYIKKNNYQTDKSIMALLYGFICHYTLDSICHPFIYYKTGSFQKSNKDTYKYNGLHNDMETFIDMYMEKQNEGLIDRHFLPHIKCLPLIKFNEPLIKTIHDVFYNTYQLADFDKYYLKSIHQARNITKIVRYDPTKLKRYAYKIIDQLTSSKCLKLTPLVYSGNYLRKKHYLNLDHNEWNHPGSKDEIYTYSFIELYSMAIKKAILIINKSYDIIYHQKRINTLTKYFPIASYKTNNDHLQFFEF